LQQPASILSISRSQLRSRLAWYLWLLMLIVLPVTSFPPIAESLGGIVLVSPLAMLPMILLIIVAVMPGIVRGQTISGLSKPILFFALSALISALAAFLLPILPYKGQTVINRELRAGITLVIGLGFYISALAIPLTRDDLRSSLRAIFLGLLLLTVWSAIQSWTIFVRQGSIPGWVSTIHRWFSVRDPFADRLTGLAYEPSWLGDQLVILYLPLLLASVVSGVTVFRRHRNWLSVELILLASSVAILVLTKSRISLLSFSAMLGGLVLVMGFRILKKWIGSLLPSSRSEKALTGKLTSVLSLLLLLAVCVMLALGLLWGMTKLDPRLSELFHVGATITEFRYFYPQDVIYALGGRLTLAERFVYWTAAFRTFSTYPLLGVGPGNAGFMFEKVLPVYGYQLMEIQNVLSQPIYGFPNPKSLWLRILAEQGIIGMASFAVWLIFLGLSARALIQSKDRFDRFIGVAGGLALIAQVFEGFSLDTYALPQLWIALGLLSAWTGKRLRDVRSNPEVLPAGSRQPSLELVDRIL